VKAGQSGVAFAAGAEGEYFISYKEILFGRLGFITGRSTNAGAGISAGAGLRNNNIQFDYAFSPFGDLGSTHRITIALKFGKDRGTIVMERKAGNAYRGGKTPAQRQKRKSSSQDKERKPAPTDNEENQINFMW
jgi:hypothetical protein